MRGALDRLSVRVLIVSVVHLVSMLGVIILMSWATFEPSLESGVVRHAELCVVNMVGLLGDPLALKAEAESLEALDVPFAVYTEEGALVTASSAHPIAPLAPAERARLTAKSQILERGTRALMGRSLRLPNGTTGYALFSPPPFHAPIQPLLPGFLLALVASAAGSIFLARSFARPLAQLSDAAHKLGTGDLSVRANLVRGDEFGQLADAFDNMAERVGQLVRTQQELLANVSHELRTPLARIRVALDLAAEGDTAMVREALRDITEDLAELERLVADVLQTARFDLARGRAGLALPVLREEEVDLVALVEKTTQRFGANHPERTLAVERPGELGSVRGDPALLRRVLDNLLDNAQKYSERGTPIRLEVARGQDAVSLSVEDRGIGISAEDLPRITTPFFRTDRSRARKTGGLGLGLSLARRIVEAHGGTLRLESRLGEGTRVEVRLPHASSAAA
jgi:two-component system OmpR family sensor kinase